MISGWRSASTAPRTSALAHPGGAIAAVLGAVLNVYPPGNRALAQAIRGAAVR
ncbi:MAG: hypothetical protein U0521_19905 [Anaerolineae bacterium]